MVIIKSQKKDYGVAFPTSIDDITPDILKSVTDHVILPKHYCIVGMCFRTNLFDFVTKISKGKGADIPVVNLLAKFNADDTDVELKVGDRIIVDRSSIERGHHLNIPIAINSTNACQYFEEDKDLVKSIMDGSYLKERNVHKSTTNIYLLEFKIIPINDIVADVPLNYKSIDPFKVLV